MKVKSLIMTENNYENSKQSTKCWICKKQYNKEDVDDHCHISVKYRGSVHKDCNLNFAFHNWQNFDSHLTFKKHGWHNFKINVISKNI